MQIPNRNRFAPRAKNGFFRLNIPVFPAERIAAFPAVYFAFCFAEEEALAVN